VDISIIIINYNTFELTCSCIDSIVKYTQGVSYEVILVDNASVECNPDMFIEKFPNIKLIKSTFNRGFAAGNNLGIEASQGDYILLMNSDTLLNEDSISICYKIAKKDSGIGVVTCMLKYADGSIQKQCQRFPSIIRTTMELFRVHKLIPQPARGRIMLNGFFDHLTSTESDSVWGTFFMFPRKILSQFKGGKLHEDFFMYAEDLLWCYTIKQLGYRIRYIADTSITHLSKGSSSAPDAKLRQYNEYKFVVKYYGWLFAKILVLLRSLLYFTSFGKSYSSEISGIYFKLFIKGKVV